MFKGEIQKERETERKHKYLIYSCRYIIFENKLGKGEVWVGKRDRSRFG